MRILHVVSFTEDELDGDGAAVAVLNQCAELHRRGHEVHLLALLRGGGAAAAPQVLDGVCTHLVGDGVRMGRWLAAHLASFDMAHLHLRRDLPVLRAAGAARRAGVPYLVQAHGDWRPGGNHATRLVDRFLTGPALRRAAVRLAADPAERAALEPLTLLAGHEPAGVHLLPDGVAPPEPARPSPAGRSGHRSLDVVCVGRLGDRVQPLLFAQAALLAVQDGLDATFSMVGRDGGGLTALQEFIDRHAELQGRLRYEGPLGHAEVQNRLSRADVLLLPVVPGARSTTLLEALAGGLATLCTTDAQHAITLRSRQAARVVPPTAAALAAAVTDLAADPDALADLGRRGRAAAGLLFSIEGVADHLERHYAAALLQHYPFTETSSDAEPAASGPSGGDDLGVVIDLAVPQRRRPVEDDLAGDADPPLGGADRLLWVTPEATSHRIALWREIARSSDLTVALLAPSHANRRLRLAATREPFHIVQLGGGARTGGGAARHRASRTLRALVRARPDAIVLDGWPSPAFTAAARWARRAGVAVVAYYRTSEATSTDRDAVAPRVRADRSLRRLLHRADAVLATGADSAFEAMSLGVPAERITLAPPVPDLPRSEQLPAHRGTRVVDVRSGHRFAFIGPLIPRANPDGMLHAFRLARGMGDVLTVSGAGPLYAELLALADRLGIADHVVFQDGPGDDAARRAVLSDSHTVILPSTDQVPAHEVEEALRTGRHVVVSTACAISDALAERPEVFLASPTGAALAEAMMLSRQQWDRTRAGQQHPNVTLPRGPRARSVVGAGGGRRH